LQRDRYHVLPRADARVFVRYQPFINPAYTVNPAFATDGIPDRSETFEQFQPKASVNWELTDDFALFASYGYGFRSGGFNSSGSAATAETFYGGLTLDDGTPNLRDVSDTYDKEISKAASSASSRSLPTGR
jgi:iron complex outermembrane receptor protein